MRHLLLCVLVSALVAGVVAGATRGGGEGAHESVFERVSRTGEIHCGYSVWKPLLWVDPVDGSKKGIFADLIEEIGRRLNLKIVWQEELGWGTVIESIKSARVDMACAGYWLQPNRFRHVAASTPLLYTPLYAWGRAGGRAGAKTMEDLNNPHYTVVGIDGSAENRIKDLRFPKAKALMLPEMATNADVIETLVTGKADFALDDPTSFEAYDRANPHKIANLFPGQPLALFPIVMLLPPEDAHFKQMIDDAMKSIEYDGTLDAILRAHGMDKAYLRNPAPLARAPQLPEP